MISARTYPPSELAADALAVLDAEGLARVHLASIGWGVATALYIAAHAPERIASLVLAQPYVPHLFADHPDSRRRDAGKAHLDAIEQAADVAVKGLTDRALDLYLGTRLGEGWGDGLTKARLGAIRRAGASLAPLLAGIAADRLERETLRGIQAPITVIVPKSGTDFERGAGEIWMSLLPRAQVYEEEPESQFSGNHEWTPGIARALMALTG